ncbi:MAG TPA: glycosyltransferase family 4 protein [Propionibacteriaceae bacterium]|nr:glycosyltransferase family 4 protein [Propionibacteriaceae bacterium]
MSSVHVVVPDGIEDPTRPSGGNRYDHRVCQALAAAGWTVNIHPVAGSWPWPDVVARQALARLIHDIPDGAAMLVDGLIASTVPAVLVPEARRLRLVVLLHMLLGDDPPGHRVVDADTGESAVLAAASQIVVPSVWMRERLLTRYPVESARVHVAEPGVDVAHRVSGTEAGDRLLCVAAVTAHKGHDLLVSALAANADRQWGCAFVGTVHREPEFVRSLRRQAEVAGIGERICFLGARTGGELDQAYASADLLVLASRAESYGMVVTEALARGLPVIATAVGGVPEALGRTSSAGRPGLLVRPGDRQALAEALADWLGHADLRQQLRSAARERRTTLSGWTSTADRIAAVLTESRAGAAA